MKTCTKCKIEYPLSEFYKVKRAGKKKGIYSWCKLCCIEATKEAQEFKPEYYKELRAKYAARPDVQARKRAYDKSERRLAAMRFRYKFDKADPEKLKKMREKHARSWAKLMADPKRLAERNARRRERYAIQKLERQQNEATNPVATEASQPA